MTDPAWRRTQRRGRAIRRRPPSSVLRWALPALLAAAAFALGIALGQALDDNPGPEPPSTVVRTLRPLELAPEPVTVTVAG